MSDDNKPDGTETGADDATRLPDDHPLVKAYAAERAKNRELKAKADENAEKARKYDEHEAANQSELEKMTARAEKAEQLLAERNALDERTKVRDEVAKAKGIPAGLLRGSSKEEFEGHADELIAAGIKPAAAPSSNGQGDTGDQVAETDEKSADELVDAALNR